MSDDAFRARYGPWAVIAGASEGLGAAFARQVAARGIHLVLVARRGELLAQLAKEIESKQNVEVRWIAADLAEPAASEAIVDRTKDLDVGLLIYNAAVSVVGSFLGESLDRYVAEQEVNCRRPLELTHHFTRQMAARGRGGVLLMSSLAGSQGSPYIAHYGATKAWNRIFAEGLWGELRAAGLDAMACSAGATKTPRYLAERPEEGTKGIPEMEPDQVVREALAAFGKQPSMIPGTVNRAASFFLQRLIPRRAAVSIMGRASKRAVSISTS